MTAPSLSCKLPHERRGLDREPLEVAHRGLHLLAQPVHEEPQAALHQAGRLRSRLLLRRGGQGGREQEGEEERAHGRDDGRGGGPGQAAPGQAGQGGAGQAARAWIASHARLTAIRRFSASLTASSGRPRAIARSGWLSRTAARQAARTSSIGASGSTPSTS